jgi:peptide/nickel transport system permease protein
MSVGSAGARLARAGSVGPFALRFRRPAPISRPAGSDSASPVLGPATRAVLGSALRTPSAQVGLMVLGTFVVMAVLAPWLVVHDPSYIEPLRRLQPPSSRHWLGTDDLGRDVAARLVHGARTSMVVAGGVAVASIVLGTLIGLVAGYHRRYDELLMRGVDGLMAFPGILLGITLVVRLGPQLRSVLLALTLVYTPLVARLVRGATLMVRDQPFVEAARASGASGPRILRLHVLPNVASPLLAQWSFIAGLAVLSEASLSFLGASVGPEASSWGAMLRDGQRLLASAWWMAVPPGIALTSTVLACTLIGDALRDSLDPRSRRRGRRRRPH